MSSPLIDQVQKPYLKTHVPVFHVGDTVDVPNRQKSAVSEIEIPATSRVGAGTIGPVKGWNGAATV